MGGTISTSSENSEVAFVPPQRLHSLDIHPSMRLRITHGLDPDRDTPYLG